MTYWKQQEYRIRDLVRKYFPELGIERVPGSGAANLTKGDIADNQSKLPLHLDNKSTIAVKSITVEREELEKIAKQAGTKIPVMTLTFKGHSQIYAVIKLDDLLELSSMVYHMLGGPEDWKR